MKPGGSRIGAIVLAAGRSSRMGSTNKLLAELAGRPLVHRVLDTVTQLPLDVVVVVTGHQSLEVRAALADLPVRFVDNPRYASGIGSSVAVGVEALSEEVDGLLVILGDMPWLDTASLEALLSSFERHHHDSICVPTSEKRRGNPVLWGRRYFAELAALEGDRGARSILAKYPEHIVEVPVNHRALKDIDTIEALERSRRRSDF